METFTVQSQHSVDRYRKRVAKTKRIAYFSDQAKRDGLRISDITNKLFAKKLQEKSEEYGSEPRVYRGVIYWFYDNFLVTVYQVPRQFRGKY